MFNILIPLFSSIHAVGAGGGEFTKNTMSQVAFDKIRSDLREGVGHYAALEAPEKLAAAILNFIEKI